jgi:hypothetical protein
MAIDGQYDGGKDTYTCLIDCQNIIMISHIGQEIYLPKKIKRKFHFCSLAKTEIKYKELKVIYTT